MYVYDWAVSSGALVHKNTLSPPKFSAGRAGRGGSDGLRIALSGLPTRARHARSGRKTAASAPRRQSGGTHCSTAMQTGGARPCGRLIDLILRLAIRVRTVRLSGTKFEILVV